MGGNSSLEAERRSLYFSDSRIEDHHGKLGDWYDPVLNQSIPPWKSLMSSRPPEDVAFAA